jgi:transposase-like protein
METKKVRRKIDTALKTRAALDAIRGEKTAAELGSHYGVHPNQISKWKAQAIKGLPGVFSGPKESSTEGSHASMATLYEEIGRLNVELSFLKKKSLQLG